MCCDAARDLRLSVGRAPRPRVVIVLFDDIGKHKSIPVTRHSTDESRFARIFAERPAKRADRLAQCAIGYDDIAPDAIEDFPPMYRLVTTLDEKDKKVEVARDERQLTSIADQQPSAWGEDEVVEPVAGHSRSEKNLCPLSSDEQLVPLFIPFRGLVENRHRLDDDEWELVELARDLRARRHPTH